MSNNTTRSKSVQASASKKLPWFRMYVDFLTDPKIISIAFEDQRHFIGVLALKSDGALDGVSNPSLLDRIVAQRLWIDHGSIQEVKRRLVEAGLIDKNWQPLAWNNRQFQSDSSVERVRKHRMKRYTSVTVTSPDTEADTDTESEADISGPTEGRITPVSGCNTRDDTTDPDWEVGNV